MLFITDRNEESTKMRFMLTFKTATINIRTQEKAKRMEEDNLCRRSSSRVASSERPG